MRPFLLVICLCFHSDFFSLGKRLWIQSKSIETWGSVRIVSTVPADGQVRGSGVSVLSESKVRVIGGVRVRLGGDVVSLDCFVGGLRVAGIKGVGSYEVSGLFQARQRHVALLLDPIIMLLG